ncbi:MAG: S-methyl-5'-thioinosine phosphorylase [Gammaproteobacteria bacterium]|nr:S-methyl-5'-thioinosine phosphorylase [Gammaproteobacteria bacterium]
MKMAIIGGSGLYHFQNLNIMGKESISTIYGEPSADIIVGQLENQTVLFLPRHGIKHQIAPHKVNYRANIQALNNLGAEAIISINGVGGISPLLQPGDIVIPDQVIDYTYGRENTFYNDFSKGIQHVEFTYPFDEALRQNVIQSLSKQPDLRAVTSGVYGCVQGPRFETAAEIKRMATDGCTLVGMTAMPEAVLARELELPYVSICTVANMAAGISDEPIAMEDIMKFMEEGLSNIQELIRNTLISIEN